MTFRTFMIVGSRQRCRGWSAAQADHLDRADFQAGEPLARLDGRRVAQDPNELVASRQMLGEENHRYFGASELGVIRDERDPPAPNTRTGFAAFAMYSEIQGRHRGGTLMTTCA
jgi:hypothetical protein